MLRSKAQNKRLHTLISQLGIDSETKEELVLNFTGMRETSSSKMRFSECQDMIDHLQSKLPKSTPNKTAVISKADKMRKKVLSICYEMNWTDDAGEIDWNRLNEYLLKYGYLHKDLNDYKEAELPTLITQFERLLQQYYKKA